MKKLDFKKDDYSAYTNSELKKCCDYWLRQYLLFRGENAYYYCPLKKKFFPTKDMHVAHFIDRQCMNTRYDLTNCNLISAQSNKYESQIPKEGYKSLHHFQYAEWLGPEKVKNLLDKSKIICILAKEDYLELINKFKHE